MSTSSAASESSVIKNIESAFFFLSLPFFIMVLLLPVYGKELGASAFEIGLIFSAFSTMTILARPLVGWALDRFGRRPFFITGMLGYAFTMVAFAYSDQIWGMVAARLLQGLSSACAWLSASAIIADITGPENRARYFGRLSQASSRGPILVTSMLGLAVLWSVLALCFAAGDPAEQALVADLTGGDQRGRAYGWYIMASDIGAALGPLGGGWLYDRMNPSAPFFITGMILALCALVVIFFLQIPKRAEAELPA